MHIRVRALWLTLPLGALLFGCTPKIGDKCTLSTDCSQLGDRLCDATQPEGYCTVFNCEPDNCPDAICVAVNYNLDPACASVADGRWPRFERSFCMKPCNDDSDCRDYYECVDLSNSTTQNDRRAQVVDLGANDGGLGYKVCMVLASKSSRDAGAETPAVCLPPDAGYPSDGGVPWTPSDGGTGP